MPDQQTQLDLFGSGRAGPATAAPTSAPPAEIAGQGHQHDQGEQPVVIDEAEPINTSGAARPTAEERASIEKRVLAFFIERGEQGATDHELSERLGVLLDTVRSRRCSLRDSGLLMDSGRRRPSPRGYPSRVWCINDTGLKLRGLGSKGSGSKATARTDDGSDAGDQAAGELAPWQIDNGIDQGEEGAQEKPTPVARNRPGGVYDLPADPELAGILAGLPEEQQKFWQRRVGQRRAQGEHSPGVPWRALVDVRERFGWPQ